MAGLAQTPTPPDEFIGLKWGISNDEAKQIMKAKGAGYVQRGSGENHLIFSGATAAGLAVDYWDLYFGGGKFQRGKVGFKDEYDIDGLFKQVKKILTEKYGTREKETFKGDPSADWHLTNLGSKDGITIHLYVHSKNRQKHLKLEYINDALAKQFPDAPEEKAGQDDKL